MDIHVNIGKTAQDTVQKRKIIVGLLQVIPIMMEVLGVIYLVLNGIAVTYQYVEVSKPNPINTYRSGVYQM
jgi:hypothetical protein